MEILSKEMIKPSSSTPQHLHKHNLSFLDQTAPPTHVPLIFFYESPTDDSVISQNLKQSLSQVLTRYYPLAGRIIVGQGIEPPYVDCNDAGVEYVETRVHARMSDVATEDTNPGDLQKYVWNFQFDGRIGKIPLFIQSNLFDCGGVALGVSISHNIADMASLASFMNDWSATCRQSQQQLPINLGPEPDFGILSSHFPARTSMITIPSPPPPDESLPPPPRIAMKRFVFDKEMLSELKRVGSGLKATNPSRVESVTAFVWGSTISINSATTKYAATHAVNVRSRMTADRSLAARGFGNGCAQAVAWWDDDEDDDSNTNIPERITAKLRGAIRGIDVGKIRDHDQHFGGSNVEFCIFSSWCRFPVYEVDYGWGKPHWVATVGVPFKNLVALLDTKDGDGVEAWVSMVEADMALIEANYKRLCMKLQTPA